MSFALRWQAAKELKQAVAKREALAKSDVLEPVVKDWAKWNEEHRGRGLSKESYHYSMASAHGETADKAFDKNQDAKGDKHAEASAKHYEAAKQYALHGGNDSSYVNAAEEAEKASKKAGAVVKDEVMK